MNWTNIKGAVLSSIIVSFLAVGAYIIGVGDIFSISIKAVINIGVLAGLGSLIKSIGTTHQGTFLGVKVK